MLWDVDEILKPAVRPGADTKRLIVPLAMLLVPDLLKNLRASVSSTTDKRGQPIKELGALAAKIFREFIGSHTSIKTDLTQSGSSPQTPIPAAERDPHEGQFDDPLRAGFRSRK